MWRPVWTVTNTELNLTSCYNSSGTKLQNNFIKFNSRIQETLKNWDNKILPHLPQQMDEMAKRAGAMQRKRSVCSCVDCWGCCFSTPAQIFHSVSLLSPPVPLEFPLFLTLPGGSIFQKPRLSCVKYCTSCFLPFSGIGYFCFCRSEECASGGCVCHPPGGKAAEPAAHPPVLFLEWKQDETGESFRPAYCGIPDSFFNGKRRPCHGGCRIWYSTKLYLCTGSGCGRDSAHHTEKLLLIWCRREKISLTALLEEAEWSSFMKEHCTGLIDVETITSENKPQLPL